MARRLLPLLLLAAIACESDPIIFEPEEEALFTFDGGLDGWVPIDLGLAPGSSFSVVATGGAAEFTIDAAAIGGEALIAREFVLTPEVDYVVSVELVVEPQAGTDLGDVTVVAGSSVEGAPFQFAAPSAGSGTGASGAVSYTGDLRVTGGLEENDDDFESEIRIGVGFRPLSGSPAVLRVDDVRVRFVRAEVAG